MSMDKTNKKIEELQEQISKTKYNKKTQHAIGLMKAQLARLKDKRELIVSKSKGAKEGYVVKRSGDGTVIMVGFPSTGKSTLLNALTNADSEVGSYAFTTLTVVPGMLEYEHAKIQILDVPGIVRGAASGKGRGKEVLSAMRNADMCLILLDSTQPNHLPAILKEVYETGVRINQKKLDVKIKKTGKDGIKIGKTVKLSSLNDETIKGILQAFRINNAEVLIRENINEEQFIDCIQDNKKYMASITVLNKVDAVSKEQLENLKKKLKVDIAVSAKNITNIEKLKKLIFKKLELVRIYLKEPGKKPDLDEPLIMFKNCTVKDVCQKLHRDFVDKFRFSKVWGKSAKFGGQKLMLNHVLRDGDVLELFIR
ncbi:GTP-binding protein [Candidatus Woesearchaeota archaeon]|nr:GTP-binding protein [Candidatus Woesearchaeota archaeon]